MRELKGILIIMFGAFGGIVGVILNNFVIIISCMVIMWIGIILDANISKHITDRK